MFVPPAMNKKKLFKSMKGEMMHLNKMKPLDLRLFGAEAVVEESVAAEDPSELPADALENPPPETDETENAPVSAEPVEPETRADEARERLILAHFARMERQAEAVREQFPDFDLRRELRNPVFARMTAPDVGISVEDAYYAVHGRELLREAAQIIAERLSNAIVSGSRRPHEAGVSAKAPSVSAFDYAKAGKAQREEFKKDLRARMARGEKVYPNR
jgi:hypothetical protein